MSVAPDNKKIQIEDTVTKKQLTEYNANKIAAALNYLLQNNPSQVGDLQESMLNETQFQTRNGTDWVLADGRNIEGTKYGNITGEILAPDCRANFLRAADNGAGVDDGRLFRSEQLDDNKSHSHLQVRSQTTGASAGTGTLYSRALSGGFSKYWQGTSDLPDVGATAFEGDSEAKPTNTALNIFIKIN